MGFCNIFIGLQFSRSKIPRSADVYFQHSATHSDLAVPSHSVTVATLPRSETRPALRDALGNWNSPSSLPSSPPPNQFIMTTPNALPAKDDIGTIELTGIPFSTFTRSISLGLHELSIPFIHHKESKPHGPDAKSLNPFGLLPSLVHVSSVYLFDSSSDPASLFPFVHHSFPPHSNPTNLSSRDLKVHSIHPQTFKPYSNQTQSVVT